MSVVQVHYQSELRPMTPSSWLTLWHLVHKARADCPSSSSLMQSGMEPCLRASAFMLATASFPVCRSLGQEGDLYLKLDLSLWTLFRPRGRNRHWFCQPYPCPRTGNCHPQCLIVVSQVLLGLRSLIPVLAVWNHTIQWLTALAWALDWKPLPSQPFCHMLPSTLTKGNGKV